MQRRIRTEKRLRVKDIDRLEPGTHEDGGGLRFVVERSGARRWVLRVTINGKRHNRGLGSYPLVNLESAREEAAEIRRAARKGRDLVDERRQEAAKAITFKVAFETFFEVKRQQLANAKHVKQWPATMATYVFPPIGHRPVAEITRIEIIELLKPIWFAKPETAKRVLQRVDAVFDSVIANEQREKVSPCFNVAKELGTRHREVEHHRALPHAEVRDFIKKLHVCSCDPVTKLAFEWLILTATRSNETRGAVWTEIDTAKALWTIPKERMKKGRKEHIVPLSNRCLEIARQARALNPDSKCLFPAERSGKPFSDNTFGKVLRIIGLDDRATAHGFRSSFKDWCAEVAKVNDEVSEAALSHKVSGKARAAYLRTRFVDERRDLMHRWADYCAG
jgi:integrase